MALGYRHWVLRAKQRKMRHYLFLQGPHGPFFAQLARRLSRQGARVTRVGFNAGDRVFWPRRLPYRAFRGRLEDWPEALASILAQIDCTDVVLYGDAREIHAEAIRQAQAAGLRLHVFEEGYLRPYWTTYERGGSNGNSRLMKITEQEIVDAIGPSTPDLPNAPGSWGAMRAHVFYGALYHFCVLTMNRRYRALGPHRGIGVGKEAQLYLKLLAMMVPHWMGRIWATRRVLRQAAPFHLVLLQLSHDASFRTHGPFPDMGAFLSEVVSGFAKGAPSHHHLVFKSHPLEDGRFPLRAEIKRLTDAHGIADRVHFVRGGKLARLLDNAVSAVTVNSTAAHQALWRGLPVKALGRAIYTGRGFTSDQALSAFFGDPKKGSREDYMLFRRYLLATSQVPGSYYSAAGRRQILRRLIDIMLVDSDRYDAIKRGKSGTEPKLFAVPDTGR